MLRFKPGDRVTSIKYGEKGLKLKITIVSILEKGPKQPFDYEVRYDGDSVFTLGYWDRELAPLVEKVKK